MRPSKQYGPKEGNLNHIIYNLDLANKNYNKYYVYE